jgi:dUTP pyrophosphatase
MSISVYIDEPKRIGKRENADKSIHSWDYELRFQKGSLGAAGYDLHAALSTDELIIPGGRSFIPTGIYMEMPVGIEGQIRPRSGLLRDWGVGPLVGTIDSDYRGEIKVTLFNFGNKDYTVKPGDRIAQIVFGFAFPVPHDILRSHYSGEVEIVDNISRFKITDRGESGFGSTGR